mmetsp:Transcript_88492/g.253481  ORF Transcript_88492/g.253481 Transcript_88492/m.253481 type:complete len:220 (-) Transcript_88492:155-814(-)
MIHNACAALQAPSRHSQTLQAALAAAGTSRCICESPTSSTSLLPLIAAHFPDLRVHNAPIHVEQLTAKLVEPSMTTHLGVLLSTQPPQLLSLAAPLGVAVAAPLSRYLRIPPGRVGPTEVRLSSALCPARSCPLLRRGAVMLLRGALLHLVADPVPRSQRHPLSGLLWLRALHLNEATHRLRIFDLFLVPTLVPRRCRCHDFATAAPLPCRGVVVEVAL